MHKRKLGVVGVDSGRIILTDPCRLKRPIRHDGDSHYNPEFEEQLESFAQSGEALQLKFARGHAGLGVAVNCPIGDGYYPVYALFDQDDQLVGIEIFLRLQGRSGYSDAAIPLSEGPGPG